MLRWAFAMVCLLVAVPANAQAPASSALPTPTMAAMAAMRQELTKAHDELTAYIANEAATLAALAQERAYWKAYIGDEQPAPAK